jgi:ABC-type multidrug transport system fused ATPase/permease subunit
MPDVTQAPAGARAVTTFARRSELRLSSTRRIRPGASRPPDARGAFPSRLAEPEPAMDQSIFRFIWRHSKRQQLWVILVTAISFPFLYYSLDLPKTIVDEAIGGEAEFPIDLFGLGLAELGQVEYLFTLSGIFLLLVLINGGFKYYINVYRGQLGERMLRRLRYELYFRVLRFRLPQFKRMSSGEIIPMITSEVEPLGGFIGDAFALPAFQGGTLLVYLAFIFIQDPILGAAAISLYPIQAYVIPKLQRRVNELGKQRVRTVRRLADRIGETVSGAQEIHAHDTGSLHLADTAARLGRIFEIRYEIFKRKFFIKFLNNFLNQLTPFFFYSIGGYLVLQGSLSFGALVAVLAAYKDLAGPWRELLNYYQMKEDVRIKYGQVIEQFQPADIMDPAQLTEDVELDGLPSVLSFQNVGFAEEGGLPALEGVSVDLPLDRHVAVLGAGGSGRTEFMLLAARLLVPSSGRIRLGDHDWATLGEAVIGRRFAYVGATPFLFTDTLRANLYYGLKHRPLADPDRDDEGRALRHRMVAEALASGNTIHDVEADWIDYAAAGVDGAEALEGRAIEVLDMVELSGDVYRMGLGGTIDPTTRGDLADRLLEARTALGGRLADPELGGLVEQWDETRFNTSATVAENLLFGTPVGPTFSLERLAENAYVLSVLDKTGLTDPLIETGAQVAETMIELFADLPPGHEFFEQFSFISSDELPDFQPLVTRVNKEGIDALDTEARARLLALPFKLIPSRHRLGLVEEDMQGRLLEARRLFARDLPEDLAPAIEFFDPERYNASASIQDNLLFGKIRYGQAGNQERVQTLIGETIEAMALRDTVVAVGLDNPVGVAGGRLSAIQRQKLGLARAVIKRPEVLLLDEATASMDGGMQNRVLERLRTAFEGRGLIWSLHRPGLARHFDEVFVFKNGRLAERGRFDDLQTDGSALRELTDAE